MDARKVAFLFGELPPDLDPDDQEVRHRLVRERVFADRPVVDDGSPASALIVLQHQSIADQIAADDPPEVWQTAVRLLDAGLTPSFVMTNLFLAASSTFVNSLRTGGAVDHKEYRRQLERLPLPPLHEVIGVLLLLLRDRRAVSSEELVTAVLARFSANEGDSEYLEHWVDKAVDAVLDHDPSFMMIPPDLVVHVPTILDGAVLTHRLTDSERSENCVHAGADLAALLHRSDRLELESGGEVEFESYHDGDGVMFGPDGWLEDFDSGTLLAFRVGGNILSISEVAEPEGPRDVVMDAARAAYDREVDQPWLPVGADEIVVGMLLEDPGILATPTVPISELLTHAGLEQRGIEFAHDESVWRAAKLLARLHVVFERLDEGRRGRAADVLEVFDASEREATALHHALVALSDHRILSVVTDLLLDLDDDVEQLDEVDRFAADLLGAARRPRDGAPARWLMAVISERRCDPLSGLAHLELAVKADPEFLPAVDRLAWYLSDRGDARGAVRLWRSLGVSEADSDDLREVVPFAEQAAVRLGRNEACWCGSGRKFKQCHLGQPEKFELPDRVGWLCRKAVAYLERRGGVAPEHVYQLAVVRADGDDSEEAVDRAFADPMVMDVALHEDGWFDRFIEERGALLPDDEAILARAWTFVDRTLYEVVETKAGNSMTVRDLRSAELFEVRERTFSRQARIGQVLCARAVPDGETHQFVGGIFGVATGEEKDLLDLLDTCDGTEILEWLAAKSRPPRLTTREGEDMRVCKVALETGDPEVAREVLDRFYDPHGEGQWTESHELGNGESILRATIELDGGLITVETLSEPRVERVLDVLLAEIDGITVVSDDRRDHDPSVPPPGPRQPPMSMEDPAVKEALRTFIAERERIWCDEEIPALGGLTPRQAAADPVGREALDRLLGEYGSYVDLDADPELVAQHPDRLRRLLGLV
jgi:hypothetical protein